MLHAQNWPANSVSCYMHRTGLSEELALEHVRNLIDENRKKLNKERLDDSLLAKPFIETAFNLARQARRAYQNGDGYSGREYTIRFNNDNFCQYVYYS
jgi:isoprene synthase